MRRIDRYHIENPIDYHSERHGKISITTSRTTTNTTSLPHPPQNTPHNHISPQSPYI